MADLACPGSLLYSMFIHWGLLHLTGNLFFFWIVGDNVETVLGSVRFALLYLGSGLVAGIVQAVNTMTLGYPPYPVFIAGASGAIAGVMGAYLLIWPGAEHCWCVRLIALDYYCFRFTAAGKIGMWVGLQGFLLLLGLPVGVWAHLAGFITGIALASVLAPRERIEALREELSLDRHRGLKPGIWSLAFPSLPGWVKVLVYVVSAAIAGVAVYSLYSAWRLIGDYFVVLGLGDMFGRHHYAGFIFPRYPTGRDVESALFGYDWVRDYVILHAEMLDGILAAAVIAAAAAVVVAIFAVRAVRNAEEYEVTYIGLEKAKELHNRREWRRRELGL